MLEKHANKGQGEPWKVYAWCVRDVICKNSDLLPLDERLSLKDRFGFEKLMNGEIDQAEINGQTFRYEGGTPVQELTISNPGLMRRLSTVSYERVTDKVTGEKDFKFG